MTMKKLLLGVIIAALAVLAFSANRPSYEMEALDWYAMNFMASFPMLPVTTKKDLLVHMDAASMGDEESALMSIRRRNNDGNYEYAANVTEAVAPFATTNGRWIGLFGSEDLVGVTLFHIDENNVISGWSNITSTTGGFLLSDDTFVGFDPTGTDDGNFEIRTYRFDSTNNSWASIPGTELTVTSMAMTMGDFGTYRVYDNHLVMANFNDGEENVTVHIYERLADLSWNLIDVVPINGSGNDGLNLLFNGLDTIVVGLIIEEAGGLGVVNIYSKKNGVWTENKFSIATVDYRPLGYFGLSGTFVNSDTLLLTAAFEGYGPTSIPSNIGKVLMMTRKDGGDWEPTLDLIGSGGIFGLGVAVNDHDIIVSGLSSITTPLLSYYTAPLCFTEPIDVTCRNERVDDCSEISPADLYTINNPQCGAVSVLIDSLSVNEDQGFEARYNFSRSFGPSVSCTATVTCNSNVVSHSNMLHINLIMLVACVALIFM